MWALKPRGWKTTLTKPAVLGTCWFLQARGTQQWWAVMGNQCGQSPNCTQAPRPLSLQLPRQGLGRWFSQQSVLLCTREDLSWDTRAHGKRLSAVVHIRRQRQRSLEGSPASLPSLIGTSVRPERELKEGDDWGKQRTLTSALPMKKHMPAHEEKL